MSLVIREMWQERQSYRQKNDSGACSKLLSETRDMFSTLVPSGGEMIKEPLYVFSVCIQCMYSVYVFSVLFRNAERGILTIHVISGKEVERK